MTDEFEKWLEKEAGRVSKKVMGQGDTFDNGREQAYLLSLRKYREFLKKPTPKEHPLVFWGGIYHKWDETKKRFIPQFVARRLK